MIKIKCRRNLIYLFAYYIAWIINESSEEIIASSSFTYPLLSIVGNIIGGLIVYLCQYHFLKRNKQVKYFGINLITNKNQLRTKDNKIKIGFLLFFASYFYTSRFIINYQFSDYLKNSPSIDYRLSSIQTISAALICTYALGFGMKKHHKLSLIIISIFLGLTFIIEIISKVSNINLDKCVSFNFFIFYYNICETFSSCIEKYLVDINYINPFLILMLEGIIELIFSIIYISIYNDNFDEFISKYIEITLEDLILSIIGFIVYIIIAAITNIYKIYCNVIYSPMARSLIEYLLNPFLNIYTFFKLNDFNKSVVYLIISIIICIVISFFGCVYNEYIILFCCGLEYETEDIIIERSRKTENAPKQENYRLLSKDTDNDSEKENDA